MSKIELKTCLALGAIFAFRMLGLFMIVPIFSLYATKLPGSTPTLIGLALGIYGLTQALFQLPFGIWSDFHDRKRIIAIGLIIFALGSLVAALSHSLYGIILGRALQGAGAIGSVTIALVGDLTEEQNRTHAMAIVGIMIGLSFIVAIILGPSLGHIIGVPGLFWLTTLFALIGLVILWKIPSPKQQHREFNIKSLPSQFKVVLNNRLLQANNLSIAFAHALLMASFVALPKIITSQSHMALGQEWQLYLPSLFVSLVLIGGVLRKIRQSQKEYKTLLICLFVLFLSQLTFAFFLELQLVSYGYLFIYFVLFFTSFTLLEALLPSLVSKAVDAHYRGTASGVFSSSQFLGIFLGGLWGGVLIQHFNALGVFVGNSLLALICWLIVLPLCHHQKLS